jgi:predicted amidohydrolase
MIVALASPRVASALEEGLERVKGLLAEGSAQGAEVACFPEAYLPGLRGQDFEVPLFNQAQQERALLAVARWARMYAVATILGMERRAPAGRQIVAFVIDALGRIQGCQTKNQLDPSPRGRPACSRVDTHPSAIGRQAPSRSDNFREPG